MRTLAVLVTAILLLGAVGWVGATVPTYHGPWLDSCLLEWTPDLAAVPGERALMSAEYWVWSAYPERAPQIYYLRVSLNGKPTELGADVIKVGNAYMVPADALSKLGLGVSYSADNMTITVTGKGHTLASTLYAKRATVDGFSQPAKVASRWQRGMRYISLDLIAQAFNLVVTADQGQIRISAY
jgi:hypothetical protein